MRVRHGVRPAGSSEERTAEWLAKKTVGRSSRTGGAPCAKKRHVPQRYDPCELGMPRGARQPRHGPRIEKRAAGDEFLCNGRMMHDSDDD